jgi:porin
MLTATLLVLTGGWCHAESTTDAPGAPDAPPHYERSIEDLNLQGSDVVMPPFSDTVLGVDSDCRRALLSKGVALRNNSQGEFAENVLRPPVPAAQQVYVGEHPYGNAMTHLILTMDLRQLHLEHAQLHISGVENWVSWNPAGPKTLQLWTLYFYKMFGKDRVELKAGYNANDLEFVGMQVGGSTATGVQGVYAVLPYEVGMSYFPLTSPLFNLRIRGPKNAYLKTSAQRSLDPEGGPATVARNRTGFRFVPNGDKLLLIDEIGYRRAPSAVANAAWFRAGYMRNSTLYTNYANGQKEPGNYCAYALMDYQLRRPDPGNPSRGLYLGGSAMTVPSKFNAYNRYYEARLYQEAPFRSRPGDVLSFVASHTGHSNYLTDSLVTQGKTVWRSATSSTVSYTVRVAQGNYLSLGLSYIYGPAITPRVPDTLTFAGIYSVYF